MNVHNRIYFNCKEKWNHYKIWMNLDKILSKINNTQKDKQYPFFLLGNTSFVMFMNMHMVRGKCGWVQAMALKRTGKVKVWWGGRGPIGSRWHRNWGPLWVEGMGRAWGIEKKTDRGEAKKANLENAVFW